MSSDAPFPTFLGLDLSTQQIKAVLLDEQSSVVHEAAVNFDRDLPHYGTTSGAIKGPGTGEVTSPVRMFLEAIDLLFQRLKDDGVLFDTIAAISGAGQVCAPLNHIKASQSIMAVYSNMDLFTGLQKRRAFYPSWIRRKHSPTNFSQRPSHGTRHPSGKIHPPQKIVRYWSKNLEVHKNSPIAQEAVHMSASRGVKSPRYCKSRYLIEF